MLEARNTIPMRRTVTSGIVYIIDNRGRYRTAFCEYDFRLLFPDCYASLTIEDDPDDVWVSFYDRPTSGAVRVLCWRGRFLIWLKFPLDERAEEWIYTESIGTGWFDRLFGAGLVPRGTTSENPVTLWLRLDVEKEG